MKEKYKFSQKQGVKLRKAFFLFILIAGLVGQANAQLKLGNNPNTINASALLELESSTQGLLLPRLSQQQMVNIATPASGLLVYNTDSACAYVYSNSTWTNLCSMSVVNFMQFITTSPGRDSIIQIIATNAHNEPLIDSIFHAVLLRAGNLSAASGLVTVTGGNQATLRNVTVDVNKDTLVTYIANNTNHSLLRDSIFSTVVAQGRNVSGASPITVTGGVGASLRPVTVSIDSNRIVPLGGTPGQILTRDSFGYTMWTTAGGAGDNWGTQVIAHDNTLKGNGTAGSPLGADTAGLAVILPLSPIRDTILDIVSANGKDVTGVSPILISGGTGASLQPVSVSIDSNRIVPMGGTPGQILTRDSFGHSVWNNTVGDNWGSQVISHDGTLQGNGTASSPLGVDTTGLATLLPVSPIRDTILSIVSSNGKDVTGVSPILISGGAGASLVPVSVSIDSNRIVPTGGTPGQILTRDSFGHSVWNNTVGDNWGSQVISHDGTLQGNGTASSPLGVDTTGLATLLPVSPIRDTILSIVSSNGKDVTGVSPILISGGAGASLVPVSVSIDSNRIVPIGGTPGQILTRDSFGHSVWTNTGPGDNWGSQVISHDGTLQGNGTAGSPLGVDTAGLATLLPNSPIKDTILDIVRFNAGNLSAGGTLVSVANGAGAMLHNTTVDVNKDTLVNVVINSPVVHDSVITIIANNSHNPPLRDSIFSTVVAQGRNLSSSSPAIIVNGGAGATLQNSSLYIDSSALIHLLIISHLQDSLGTFKGFNVGGSSTSNTFINLTLGLGASPNTVAAYELQSLPTTSTFPQFNDFGVISGSPTKFTAPVTGYYSLTYTVSLVVNPSLLSAGGTFSWGVALIKTNGTQSVIAATRNTQTLSASALGILGLATVGTNTVTTLVKLNAGDTVSPGLGATNGVTLSVLSSNSTIQNFTGYWVK
jgi:hypothetical protein